MAGQSGFLRTACIEPGKYGITVNAVMRGNIATEGHAALGGEYEKSQARSEPPGRLGTVSDVGHAVLYFASKEAGTVTGQTIVIGGGQVLPGGPDALEKA